MELPKSIGQDPTIIIEGVPYPVRYGARSLAIFGEMAGRFINNITAQMTVAEMYQNYYAGIAAGGIRNKISVLSYEEFMNALDNDEAIITRLVEIKTEQDAPKK